MVSHRWPTTTTTRFRNSTIPPIEMHSLYNLQILKACERCDNIQYCNCTMPIIILHPKLTIDKLTTVRSFASFASFVRSFVRFVRSFVRSLRSFVRSFVHFVRSRCRCVSPKSKIAKSKIAKSSDEGDDATRNSALTDRPDHSLHCTALTDQPTTFTGNRKRGNVVVGKNGRTQQCVQQCVHIVRFWAMSYHAIPVYILCTECAVFCALPILYCDLSNATSEALHRCSL